MAKVKNPSLTPEAKENLIYTKRCAGDHYTHNVRIRKKRLSKKRKND